MALWLSKKLVLAVEQSLSSREEGRVAGWNLGKLSKALRERGIEIEDLCLGEWADQQDKPSFSAIVVENLLARSDWAEELSRLRALLGASGHLISVDKGAPAEVSRRLLCSGLSDLSQREVGRQILTVGTAP